MESENFKESDLGEEQADATPVCLRCMEPVDPLEYYCPNCGKASGQLTQYLPFVNIRWSVDVWGRMWRQIWSRDISIPGRILRFLMIVWNFPFMLIGLLFMKSEKKESQDDKP